jgi:nitrate reductase NapD
MTTHIHIASFILLTQPAATNAVCERIAALSAIEIVARDAGGKVVLLIEADHERRVADLADCIRDLDGVLSLSMVEHHVDTREAMSEEIAS